ncbi:hypothetical protein K2173_022613 [Erythroxylum novogranatense]|uniref:Uncharacterized protein n=1 Tax=Erythroxylum novogranatense TaxID=1862640 RepID=A0AAV8TQN0_9ROSI|nr:hypothetical protein K2173_022613 [Erythroxylum novogranatense]
MPLGNRASLPWRMQFFDNDRDGVQAEEEITNSDDGPVPESSDRTTEEWKKNILSKNHREDEASSESVNSMFDTKKVVLDDDKKQDFGARNILNPYDDQNQQIKGQIKVTSPSTNSYSDDDQSIKRRPPSSDERKVILELCSDDMTLEESYK